MFPGRHAFSGIVRNGHPVCICGADMQSTCDCDLCRRDCLQKTIDSDDDTEYNTTHLQAA